jgi:hypothetical protein
MYPLNALPYVCVLSIIIIASFHVCNTKYSLKAVQCYESVFHVLVIILLLIFYGLRGFIGSDWISYFTFYSEIPALWDGMEAVTGFLKSNKYPFEDGFVVFAIISKTISPHYFFFQFFCFLFDYLILLHLFRIYFPGKNIILNILCFFIFYGQSIEFNLLRNAKAIICIILSLHYLNYNKNCKCIIFVFLGCMFHRSAFLFIPLLFFVKRIINKKLLIFLFVIGNFIYFFPSFINKIFVPIFISIVEKLLGGLIDTTILKLMGYFSSEVLAKPSAISIGYIERIISFFAVLYLEKKIIKINNKMTIFINCIYIYILLFLYFHFIDMLGGRIIILFGFSYWFIYPQIYYAIKQRKLRICFLFFLILLSFYKTITGNIGFNSKYEFASEQLEKNYSTYANNYLNSL